MIDITECFGFSITDEFGGLYSDFSKILSEDELNLLKNRKTNEPCLLTQSTVEKNWLAIAIPGRYARTYNQDDMVKLLEEAVGKSSQTMQSIYKKITEAYEIEFQDLTLYGEI